MSAGPTGVEDDGHLLAKVAQGDERAFASLYRRLGRRIFAFALQRLAQTELAEEIVVETMYEVWRSASKFQGQALPSTWILGIARHKALDKLRQRGQREMVELSEATDAIADEAATAFDRIAARQQAAQVKECMETLPDVQRECLHLVFHEELPLAEIARLQDCPENTVKTRLFHARRKMRDCLERQFDREHK